MALRQVVIGSLLVSMAAGCASPAITVPVMATTPSALQAPAAAPQLTTAPNKALITAPEKALVTAPGKALAAAPEKALIAAPEKALVSTPVAVLAPVTVIGLKPLATNLAADLKANALSLGALDDELNTSELLVAKTGFATKSFQTEGWFSDMKDKFTTWNTNRKLKADAKKALKANEQKSLDKYIEKLTDAKKKNTDQTVTTKALPDGGKEVTTTWKTTHEKESTVTTVQIFDAEGVEQSLILTETGTITGKKTFETIRSRKLLDDDGTTEVYSKRTVTDADGGTETHEWTKIIKADGSETISGTITNKNGKITKITGTRTADGTLTLDPTASGNAPAVATW